MSVLFWKLIMQPLYVHGLRWIPVRRSLHNYVDALLEMVYTNGILDCNNTVMMQVVMQVVMMRESKVIHLANNPFILKLYVFPPSAQA